MGLQFSGGVRDARLDAIEFAAGPTPILEIIEGAKPANCAALDPALVLATINLPADWMLPASGGVKSKSGTWEDTLGDAAGTAGHFRLWDATHTTCHAQGAITVTGGGGEMTVDNLSIAVDQDVIVTAFTLTDGNA